MNLTWHIVKKDLRALKWPLLLWILVIVAKLGVGVLLLTADGNEGMDWFRRMDTMAKLLSAVEGLVFVLAAALVQEDLLVGTTAFWQTRPISGGRLLCAKFLGIGLVFWVMPVLVMLPWWLGCGYGLREMAWAAGETLAVQTILVLAGLLWAVVTDGYARFLMWTLVTVFAVPTLSGILAYYASRGQPTPNPDLVSTRLLLMVTLAIAGILTVVIHQYLTRKTMRSIAVIAATAALIVCVGAWWPWPMGIEQRIYTFLIHRAEGDWPVSAEPAGLKFTLEPAQLVSPRTGTRPNASQWLRLKYRVDGLSEGLSLMPYPSEHILRWPDGTTIKGYTHSPGQMRMPPALVAMRGGSSAAEGLVTERVSAVTLLPGQVATKVQATPPGYTLSARLRLMRIESVTPVPLRAGHSHRNGSLGERVAGVEKSGEQLLVTIIRHNPSLLVDNAGGGQLAPFPQFAQYYLENKAHDFADRGTSVDHKSTRIGTVEISWATMAYRASGKGGGARPLLEAINALEDAELFRVDYTEQARFSHEFKVDPLTVELINP